jgi:hypothetical protein
MLSRLLGVPTVILPTPASATAANYLHAAMHDESLRVHNAHSPSANI